MRGAKANITFIHHRVIVIRVVLVSFALTIIDPPGPLHSSVWSGQMVKKKSQSGILGHFILNYIWTWIYARGSVTFNEYEYIQGMYIIGMFAIYLYLYTEVIEWAGFLYKSYVHG